MTGRMRLLPYLVVVLLLLGSCSQSEVADKPDPKPEKKKTPPEKKKGMLSVSSK